MITKDQISFFSHKYKTNESTVFREYLQVFFLNKLYKHKESSKIFFKGGTAIHLLWGAPRFSEDLDFTVTMTIEKFMLFIDTLFTEIAKEEKITFKERKTIAGKRFLITANPDILPYATFINLDFSFREAVLQPQKSIFDSDYPLVFTSFIYHLSGEEIIAEKVRAILTRQKGRDFYDLWFLTSKGFFIHDNLVKEKLTYYKITDTKLQTLMQKIQHFPLHEFITDMRPFVPIGERTKLKKQFDYIKTYLLQRLIYRS